MRRSALRLSLVAAALGFAALAVPSALDRASVAAPAVAARVPAAFAANAWRARAETALVAKRPGEALSAAAEAVRRDPVDPASTGLLGAALLASGKAEAAERAFRVAARFGWREPATQSYWLEAAFAAGDLPLAAQRLDALLRQSPALPQGAALLSRFEATGAGRTALAKRLALRPAWLLGYRNSPVPLSTATMVARADVLRQVAARVGPLGCEEALSLVRGLVEAGRPAEGWRLWRAQCPRASRAAAVADGGFSAARLDAPPSPFEWSFPGAVGIDVMVAPAAGFAGPALQAASSLPRREAFAVQHLRLAPGSYRLAWREQDSAGRPSARIAASLSCRLDQAEWQTARSAGGDQRFTTATIAADCPDQWLTLAILPGEETVILDDVAAVPITRAGDDAGG